MREALQKTANDRAASAIRLDYTPAQQKRTREEYAIGNPFCINRDVDCLERNQNKPAHAKGHRGDFFLRKDPLGGLAFAVQLLWFRYSAEKCLFTCSRRRPHGIESMLREKENFETGRTVASRRRAATARLELISMRRCSRGFFETRQHKFAEFVGRESMAKQKPLGKRRLGDGFEVVRLLLSLNAFYDHSEAQG